MADHPLRPANHRRLGRPLPHQLTNGPQTHPQTTAFNEEAIFHVYSYEYTLHPVLATLSNSYPGLGGRLSTCYSPVRHSTQDCKQSLSRSTCMC